MPQDLNGREGGGTSFRVQFDNLKEELDRIAYKIHEKGEDSDFSDELDLRPVFGRAGVKYVTFVQNNGYYELQKYNGVKKIPNKKKIRFNPYKWLKHRNLGKSNKYYIEEIHG